MLVHATVIAGVVGFSIFVGSRFQHGFFAQMAPNAANWQLLGFLVGAAFGANVGFIIIHSLNVIGDLITGFRAERLLIRYHDALAEAGYELVSHESEPASGDQAPK